MTDDSSSLNCDRDARLGCTLSENAGKLLIH